MILVFKFRIYEGFSCKNVLFHSILLRLGQVPCIILYLVISFATCAAFPTYRVMMFQLPILVFALSDRGFVGALASCWLSPAHVVSSSCKPSSGYWSRSRCSFSVALCFFMSWVAITTPNPLNRRTGCFLLGFSFPWSLVPAI